MLILKVRILNVNRISQWSIWEGIPGGGRFQELPLVVCARVWQLLPFHTHFSD